MIPYFPMGGANAAAHPPPRCIRLTALLSAVLLAAAGCSSTYSPDNQPIVDIDESSGYRKLTIDHSTVIDDTLLLLAFSGGGTRAAALSYGVMQELRDTLIPGPDGPTPLIDKVDSISSVSGGSFTAAYYGLYRDRLFTDFESDFLRKDIQSALLWRTLNPLQWIRNGTQGTDRTEMAVAYYDSVIFKGATFDDMAANGPPYIDINATDLTTGQRFTFNQDIFDIICTDLGGFSVSRAVTASSAVPVLFPPIVLKNHADECDISKTRKWALLQKEEPDSYSQRKLIEGIVSYRDAENRAYINLIDGGISDNLGLRAMIDRVEGLGKERLARLSENGIRNVLIILANAEVTPKRQIETSATKPSIRETMSAYTSAQMTRYNRETLDRIRSHVKNLDQLYGKNGVNTRAYFAEVSFDHVEEKVVSSFVNGLPTSFDLDDADVDKLIVTGRMLLRQEPSFDAFKRRNQAHMIEGAIADDEICRHFDPAGCSAKTAN